MPRRPFLRDVKPCDTAWCSCSALMEQPSSTMRSRGPVSNWSRVTAGKTSMLTFFAPASAGLSPQISTSAHSGPARASARVSCHAAPLRNCHHAPLGYAAASVFSFRGFTSGRFRCACPGPACALRCSASDSAPLMLPTPETVAMSGGRRTTRTVRTAERVVAAELALFGFCCCARALFRAATPLLLAPRAPISRCGTPPVPDTRCACLRVRVRLAVVHILLVGRPRRALALLQPLARGGGAAEAVMART
jgi:hypothetical protein